MSIKSIILVFIQFSLIGLLLATGPVFAKNIFFLCIEMLGIITGLVAILNMKLSNLNIFPDVKQNSILIQSGVYRYIRHPMYSAIFITMLALLLDCFSVLRLVAFLILITNLIYKLLYEEMLMRERHPGYKKYSENTYRLIPFIF